MYFNFFPKFNYTLRNKEYEFSDIFRRISFSTESLENTKAFFENYIIQGESLEEISNKYYKSPDYSWLILMANNFTRYEDFPLSEDELLRQADVRYKGKAYFFDRYMPNIRPGDVAVKVFVDANQNIISYDNDTYGVVKEYDSVFRYVWIKDPVGTITTGTYLAFIRLENNTVEPVNYNYITSLNGSTITTNIARPAKITTKLEAPSMFLNGNLNYVSPYYIDSEYEARSTAIGNYTNGDLSDVNTINNTYLNKYLASNVAGAFSIRSVGDDYIRSNSGTRIIKLLRPSYLSQVFSKIQEQISTNANKSITIDIETN